MAQNEFKTIFEAFKASCLKNSQKTAICYKENSAYVSLTYQELYNQTLGLAGFLQKNKINNDSYVAIILDNSYYWPIAFFSVMRLGATAIPISPQTEQPELRQLIIHSDTKIILTNFFLEQKLRESTKGLTIPIFNIDQLVLRENVITYRFDQSRDDEAGVSCSSDKIASIVYTSGTTSAPKGVILTHSNLLSNVESLKQVKFINPDDCVICILPLHHTYPFMLNLLFPLLLGSKIIFPLNFNLDELVDCVKKNNVTVFIGVPRIFTLLHKKIKNNLDAVAFLKRQLLNVFLTATLLLRKHLRINLAKSILAQLHQKFGTQLRTMASGGAKLNAQVARDFYKWGFSIWEGYGLTETSPVLTFNIPENFKIGSVGKPLPGVELKIHQPDQAGIGEIIARGKNVTRGYYEDSATSRESIKDGWFFTRDLGYIDNNGFVFITGRKDETIVLSSGQKISPEDLESLYSQSPYIKEICIFLPTEAQDKDFLTAVILPNLDYFHDQGLTQIERIIRVDVENLSMKLPAYKMIKKNIIINENLPKTLLGKVKRLEVAKKYSQKAQATEE